MEENFTKFIVIDRFTFYHSLFLFPERYQYFSERKYWKCIFFFSFL